MAMEGYWHILSWLQASQRMCQPSDDTTLSVLKSPQSKIFCIVRVLIPSLVFLLFSGEFVFGHRALNKHSVDPGKSRELEHLIRRRHFQKIILCLQNLHVELGLGQNAVTPVGLQQILMCSAVLAPEVDPLLSEIQNILPVNNSLCSFLDPVLSQY